MRELHCAERAFLTPDGGTEVGAAQRYSCGVSRCVLRAELAARRHTCGVKIDVGTVGRSGTVVETDLDYDGLTPISVRVTRRDGRYLFSDEGGAVAAAGVDPAELSFPDRIPLGQYSVNVSKQGSRGYRPSRVKARRGSRVWRRSSPRDHSFSTSRPSVSKTDRSERHAHRIRGQAHLTRSFAQSCGVGSPATGPSARQPGCHRRGRQRPCRRSLTSTELIGHARVRQARSQDLRRATGALPLTTGSAGRTDSGAPVASPWPRITHMLRADPGEDEGSRQFGVSPRSERERATRSSRAIRRSDEDGVLRARG